MWTVRTALVMLCFAGCERKRFADTPVAESTAPIPEPDTVATPGPATEPGPGDPARVLETMRDDRRSRALGSYRSCWSENLAADECTAVRRQLADAPMIRVTKTDVTYQGRFVTRVDRVRDSSTQIDPLLALLRESAIAIKQGLATGRYSKDLVDACNASNPRIGRLPDGTLGPLPEMICPDRLAILQADESADVRVINAIVLTANAAGFDSLVFDVTKN